MPSRVTMVLVSLLVATPAVIYWLWLVILPARVDTLCPKECWCHHLGTFVTCSLSSSIPLVFPTNARGLFLINGNVTSLKKDTFDSRGLNDLFTLIITNCQVETLEVGAFNGFKELKSLGLSHNNISEIIPRTFEDMSSLYHLYLADNIIEYLEVGVFCGLDNLVHINLGGNLLQNLHPDLFLVLYNLQRLILIDNPDLQIPTEHHFINSHSLSRLDISGCNVYSVSVETFANLSALETLSLSSNNLTSIDINILKALKQLSYLYLDYNPLQCDCQLQDVWRWCRDHDIQTVYDQEAPECDTPSEVKGIWWGVLEKGQCLEDNIYYYGDYKNTNYSYTPIEDKLTKFFEYISNFSKYVQAPTYTVLLIFGTTINVILLIIIICNKDMRTVHNMYILNLVISDMISLLVNACVGYDIYNTHIWRYSMFLCMFLPFCRRLSIGLSAYSVAVLSIRRYRVTANPFHVRLSSQISWRTTVVTICGVWILAALFAIPAALAADACLDCILFECKSYYKSVVIFELLVSCALPLCVIAFSNIMAACHLVKSARPISHNIEHPKAETRKNTAKILFGLTAVFLISFVPYHILMTYSLLSDVSQYQFWYAMAPSQLQYTFIISICLILTNSCLNPVAIFCTSPAFRKQFRRYLACCCKANSPPTDLELGRRN